MALKIRLQRKGTRNAPVYRMVVAESTSARDGRFVELLGTYAPRARGQDQEVSINLDRIDYWLSKGAKPSETSKDLIRKTRKLQPAAVAVEAPVAEAPAAEVAEPETAAETPEAPAEA